mmetsp:Transcript_16175/g.44783  ORF Transcript_16175/g.44783 Transcript_16175/m.44783 type:complete len:382 (+) Transcript_16175:329-1474(+)|eukprot:CAMPEP_0172374836 /NCGR_PEP_ID=MMETSP1060-20121228/57883_1 /TAXON_ID=37318 /ORGANISM="Pseudo-nitzschia pungens, Strain cf. cingulata" /LENGTH=381 /DNA_ID=CAMNT_0013101675 /DNA_START=298 /DNA_END=1443 /DNA_ORIENTATION=+
MGGGEISASGWAKGILLSILASIIGGASKLAIRKSWLLQAESSETNENSDNLLRHDARHDATIANTTPRDDGEQRSVDQDEQTINDWLPYCLRYSGMFGMSVLNPICCVLAMNYASPSILAPFSGLTLVWVILGSPLINSEQPSSQQVLACCLIILGEVIVAIFGDHTNDEGVTVKAVQISYTKPAFVLYFVGLVLYLILLSYWINFSDNFILRRFAWGCSGGAITGTQNFLKDSLTIIKATEPHEKLPLIFYPLWALAAGTAFAGLLMLTACMKRYDATYSSASFVGSFVVSASIMAAVHYNTFQQLDGIVNYVLYPCGLAVLMVGVYVLVRESNGHSEVDDLTQNRGERDDNSNDDDDIPEDMFGYIEVEEEEREETLV